MDVLQDDGQVACLKKELLPSMIDPVQELATYTVDVYTSHLPESGTGADVYVKLAGSKGSTGKACPAPGSQSSAHFGHLQPHLAIH